MRLIQWSVHTGLWRWQFLQYMDLRGLKNSGGSTVTQAIGI